MLTHKTEEEEEKNILRVWKRLNDNNHKKTITRHERNVGKDDY